MEEYENDPRLQYMASYTYLALKTRNEKWTKMLGIETNFQTLLDFFEKEEPCLLIVSEMPNGNLALFNKVSNSLSKSKSVYFLKTTKKIIDKTNFHGQFSCGDFSLNTPFQQLCVFVEEVVHPLFNDAINANLPTAVAEDLKTETDEFASYLFKVQGVLNGRTVLPVLFGIKGINDQESAIGGHELLRRCSLHKIESHIVDWIRQVQDVLDQRPPEENNGESSKLSGSVRSSDNQYPGPESELIFWEERGENLSDILKQLDSDYAKQLISVIEASGSPYGASFKKMKDDLVLAYEEATDLKTQLQTLQTHIVNVEQTSFHLLPPVLDVVVKTLSTMWRSSPHFSSLANSGTSPGSYNSLPHLPRLLRKISNLLVHLCCRYLGDASRLFHGELEESSEKVELCLSTLDTFHEIYLKYQTELQSHDKPWNFSETHFLDYFNLFNKRLKTILRLFETAEDFGKLEKVNFGGSSGLHILLSEKVNEIHEKFFYNFSLFSKESSKAFNPIEKDFEEDVEKFYELVENFDKQLRTVLSSALNNSVNASVAFKVLHVFVPLLNRDILHTAFTNCQNHLISLLNSDVTSISSVVRKKLQLPDLDSKLSFNLNESHLWKYHRHLPPVAGILQWPHEIRCQLEALFVDFNHVKSWFNYTDDVKLVFQKYQTLLDVLSRFEEGIFLKWCSTVENILEEKLKLPLLRKHPSNEKLMLVNFAPEVSFSIYLSNYLNHLVNKLTTLLKEIKYLKKLGSKFEIPSNAEKFYTENHIYSQHTVKLQAAISGYNDIFLATLPLERTLIQQQLVELSDLLSHGQSVLNWNSDGIESFAISLKERVMNVHDNLWICKRNCEKLIKMMNTWNSIPLFQKKREERREVLFSLPKDRGEDRITSRYSELASAGQEINNIFKENLQLLKLEENSKEYHLYAAYLDSLILSGFRHMIKCSFSSLLHSMDSTRKKPSPLFEVRLEISESTLRFIPSMDKDSTNGFPALNDRMIDSIVGMATQIPNLEKQEGQGHLEAINSDPELLKLKSELRRKFLLGVDSAKELSESLYQKYSSLWIKDQTNSLEEFLLNRGLQKDENQKSISDSIEEIEIKNKPNPIKADINLEAFKEQIEQYKMVHVEIGLMEPLHNCQCWLRINIQPFKVTLLRLVSDWRVLFENYLVDYVNNTLQAAENFMGLAETGLMGNNEEFTKSKKDLEDVLRLLLSIKDHEEELDSMFDPLQQVVFTLKGYKRELADEVHVKLQELPDRWAFVKKMSAKIKQKIASAVTIEAASIRQRSLLFDDEQKAFRRKFLDSEVFLYSCQNPHSILEEYLSEAREFESKLESLKESANLFEVPLPEYKQLSLCVHEIDLLKDLWNYIHMVRKTLKEWEETIWSEIDVEQMETSCKRFTQELRTMDREIKVWKAYLDLDSNVRNMMASLRAIGELQNSAVRERHWQQLMHTTKVTFTMSSTSTLEELLSLNLHKFEDDVKTIVDRAVKEMGMEKVLKELDQTWSSMSFSCEIHQATGLPMLKATEELIETLEDNQVQLQNLMTSKYITHFLEDISSWQKKLSVADQIISLWFEVQSTWSHLESIFISSEDIRAQLPEDTKRFESIDTKFRSLLTWVQENTNVISMTNHPGLCENLESLQVQLAICEKALAEYLETKRLAFPRFYFVSSVDLLDILSNGNHPLQVLRHMNKLFDALAQLKFKKDAAKEAIGMYSKDGEYVEFDTPCICEGPVECWLSSILETMRSTVRKCLETAVNSYEEKPREKWIMEYPAQIALTGSQIWWASEVNTAFLRLEEGYDSALKEYNKKEVQQLNALIALLLGDLSPSDRQKVMTLCTIDVHCRDVVAKIISQKIESSSEFLWQSQLRHRWGRATDLGDINATENDGKNDCYGNICDAEFKYSYEYLGNTPRLVITPLTDRCYITLTQSLHLIMGGAPAGPAGTGKTETTKDLGRALGCMVYVFNCSEQMDYRSCGSIYKGLAQTGAWGCFDEFNRIAVEVLSVIAVQVKCVQDALRDKKKIFNFFGEEIPLKPSVGIFVTMNPGYAGRAELPENLKSLFRPCAMVVPDYELICEIMLVAEGFIQAKPLARKFITLYTLCQELLSKQDHYDWGLRAIKSVLVVAGTLKRDDPDRPEEQILMRALRDFNLPKIVSDDIPVFLGLIGDLFPTLDVPRKKDSQFEDSVRQAATDLKLQPEENFILKVVQLEELLQVRHSVFVIGSSGTGKTQVLKTLFKTYQNLKKRPICYDLNPKVVTNDELFGAINPQTREWKDGLLSVLIRDLANLSGDGPKWIILDGDIDPLWIESLNSVMDDNKVLTLASNERIALTPTMRLLFEIGSLKTATPATVSRAGILYLNPTELSWSLYLNSWIEGREVQSEKANLVILFDKYVPVCLDMLKARFKKVVPIPEIAHVQMLCYLLDSLLTPENIPSDSPKELYEQYFVFACIWAFGAGLYQDHLLNYRAEFSKWWTSEFKYIRFPSNGTIFDYCIDPMSKTFEPWVTKPLIEASLFNFEQVPLQATLVPTAETVRLRYFIDLLMEKRHPVMLVGHAGSGKTLMINSKLKELPSDSYLVTRVPFNFYTSSSMLQKILEKPLEKKAGRNYGPPGKKKLVYFIDDMNMPEVDDYGTVQPHTLIRQHLDYGHWYDRVKLTLKDIHYCQYVTCMNPTAGSFTINPRLQRHFCVFAVNNPSFESLSVIYGSILKAHLENPVNDFAQLVQRNIATLVSASLTLHQKVSQTFLPSTSRFHYIFNMRDLSNIFQGLLFSTNDVVKTFPDLIRLWSHESQRVYRDKLVDEKDMESFNKMQIEVIKKNIDEPEESILQDPSVYFHYCNGLGQPKYSPITTWSQLQNVLQEALKSYNEVNPGMNLVLFEDAMRHICRISRILQGPRGNALLVGVGGSGKQSVARLAAYINNLDVFQISLHKEYSLIDLKADLAALQLKTGQKNIGVMLLLTDAHIVDENFLVPINSFLASGEIPDLLTDDEVENVVSALRNEVKSSGLPDTRENCWKLFVDRIARQLKVVLCFSPVGSTLRVRSRKFPAIVNCTTIDWFHPWPKEALISVSQRFLSDSDMVPIDTSPYVAEFMAFAHLSVNRVNEIYLLAEGRYNYTTPKTFLEQINLYKHLLRKKKNEFEMQIDRLEIGLKKLQSTSEQVDELKIKLASQEEELQKRNEDSDKLIAIVHEETVKVTAEKAIASEEEERVAKKSEEVSRKQKDCHEDLVKAEPNLIAAREALNTLNKLNLTELKSFGSPPPAVTNVVAAVMVLLASDGKIPKDRSWRSAKSMMSKVDAFLDSLVNFDKEHIHENCLKAIQPYLENPDFKPETVAGKSFAASGLCSWVVNIVKFYEVYCDVEPKRRALEVANAELQAATEKLNDITLKIKCLEETLASLTKQYEAALAEKMRCQREAEETSATIALANRMVDGLASEKVRWGKAVNEFKLKEETLIGDVLVAAAFVSYLGCFSKYYRNLLLENYWLPFFKENNKIFISNDLDPINLLTDDATIAEWNNEGLPGDRISVENAAIFMNSERWALIIDPQLQGVKWVKSKYEDRLKTIRIGQKFYIESIENGVSMGKVVLLENIGEHIDPVLDSLVGRNTIKRGRAIRIGDKEIDYDDAFKLVLHTKYSNPHYKPELQAQTALINFTVTQDGLEEQLLAEVVSKERPDLEKQKATLTKQQNDFKILLKELEDSLLMRLSAAEGNFLGDSTLVESLESTKATAAEVEAKVAQTKETESQINEAREIYRPVASRGALLYFILKELYKINPLYQFSLKAFNSIFHKAIDRANAITEINADNSNCTRDNELVAASEGETNDSTAVKERVTTLIESLTHSVFLYTSRGLFERDKLTLVAQMTFQILAKNQDIDPLELDFLMRFPSQPNITSPVEFIPNYNWGAIKMLSNLEEFQLLDRDIESSWKRWKKIADSDAPEEEKLPQDWKNKSLLQRMCILRCLRPDRMTHSVIQFVQEYLGPKYIERQNFDFAQSFEESDALTPMFFILSPGINPILEVEAYGKKKGYTTALNNLHSISLGQGQESVAEKALDHARVQGHWVVLQNIHLVGQWLGRLEKKVEQLQQAVVAGEKDVIDPDDDNLLHPNFRLFMSCEPYDTPSDLALDLGFGEEKRIPQGLLESSIKMTNEPPTGMKANLRKALSFFSQETMERCSRELEFKSILFSLCYFHAVVTERRRFGTQGWNRSYPFNSGDLTISANVLYNYLENSNKIPWQDLRFLFGEIMYGGHITDDWDRRLCNTYLEEYLQPSQLDGELMLAPGFPAPPNVDYNGYLKYVNTRLPPESPLLYGLHPNAEIRFMAQTSSNLFQTLLLLQPRCLPNTSAVSPGSMAVSSDNSNVTLRREEKIKQTIDDILEKLPEEFNMSDLVGKSEEKTPYVVVALQECERMNILTKEIRDSLRELDLGLKGELTITAEMEELGNALFLDRIPLTWSRKAYPSMLGLSSWYANLLLRIKDLDHWTSDFNLPSTVWLSGLFNPQSFLTAVMQTWARRSNMPLDHMTLQCDVTKKGREEFSGPPREGAYIHGLYLEGASWDSNTGQIMVSPMKELHCPMPVVFVRAVLADMKEASHVYHCPLYRTRQRGPTYIWTFDLPTKEKAAKWILAGCALLLEA